MNEFNKYKYITQFDITTKNEILEDLKQSGLSDDDIINALNSRLIDLEDTIDIKKYLNNTR